MWFIVPRMTFRRRARPATPEEAGFRKGLGRRQLQMIAVGSAIGTGLFLGTGARLEIAGPSVALMYLVCGIIGYFILRFLGELIVYRPTTGSFVSYAREFYGEKAAYVSGWMYWFNWAMTAVADGTAIAIYIKWFGQYSEFIAGLPQGLIALIVVVTVVGLNLLSVKVFGELEFWFSLIKILALSGFLVIGVIFVIVGTPIDEPSGLSLLTESGGLFPNGVMPALIVIQGVVFAYAGIELVGTASGEAKNARTEIPKAVNLVMMRIIVFYFGSVLLLCLLMPYTEYSAGESPFVTFFERIGVDAAAPIMQLIVITAAFSSLNAGLYSTGRILHALSVEGSAPKFTARVSAKGVPTGGILFTAVVALFGVGLNYVVPEQTFEIVLNLAALGTMASWLAITLAHLRFVKLARTTSEYNRPEYRAPGYPGLNYLTLAFLAGVIVLMAFDYPVGSWTLIVSLLFVPLLVVGWVVNRRRIMAAVDARQARKAASSQATPPEGDNPEGAPPERTPPESAPGG